MGTFRHALEVGDPQGTHYEWFEALVNTGASYTVLAASALRALGVAPARRQFFRYGDGQEAERDMGQTWIRVEGRAAMRTVVFGEEGVEPILGADTLEGLGLGVDPLGRRLIPVPGLLMSMRGEGQPMHSKRRGDVGRSCGRGWRGQ